MKPINKDERHILGRRALIRWSLAAGASMGLPRWKIFEVLEATSGKALAADASTRPYANSVHIVAGVGALSWFQFLWPQNAAQTMLYANQGINANGTDKPLTLTPASPWKSVAGADQVTALMAGSNETHTSKPVSNTSVAAGVDLFAACAAVQTAMPAVIPVIAIKNFNDVPYGRASGAPQAAVVNNAADVSGLFNSAASDATRGLLRTSESAGLYNSTYQTALTLRAAAGINTMQAGTYQGQVAASLLGQNLSAQLNVSATDLTKYYGTAVCQSFPQINGGTVQGRCNTLIENLIVTAKAMKLGLTNNVIIQAFFNDPHSAFGNADAARNNAVLIGRALDSFVSDLGDLADDTVISVQGDTPKDPFSAVGNYADNTPGNSNWMFVRGNGYLKTGWYGGIRGNGSVFGWNPANGQEVDGQSSSVTGTAGAAAVLWAVCKGDKRRFSDLTRVNIDGIAKNSRG